MVGVVRPAPGDPLEHAEHIGGAGDHSGDDADDQELRTGEAAAKDQEFADKLLVPGKASEERQKTPRKKEKTGMYLPMPAAASSSRVWRRS